MRFHPCRLPAPTSRCQPALLPVFLLTVAALLLPAFAEAQPFGAWMTLSGRPDHGYVEIPHSPALNPGGAITVEAWVNVDNDPATEDCRSIVGKNWQQSWWLGLCNVAGQPVLRSYIRGQSSPLNGGPLPAQWTHVAMVYDGAVRRHYVNGELTHSVADPGGVGISAFPVRIGSDVAWERTPDGSIDEVRVWNVARTTAQIRSTLNVHLDAPQPGLVAVWSLDGNGDDAIGGHDGTVEGDGVGFLTFPVALGCTPSATTLCVHDRFAATIQWRTPDSSTGSGMVAPLTTNQSGIFWFFNHTNWEVMVKVLDGCAINDHWWMFSAATTNVFYRLTVLDIEAGAQKIYFNYPGPPAPAVTDTTAFATCP